MKRDMVLLLVLIMAVDAEKEKNTRESGNEKRWRQRY